MKYGNSVPVVATDDVIATVAYYRESLGFGETFLYGEPPVYAGLERDGVLIYATLDIPLASALKKEGLHPEIFLWVHEIDVLYAEHIKLGLKVVEEIADRPWDARQYVIEDPNGYYLKIAEPL